jgi:DegV family protein with EDD domain
MSVALVTDSTSSLTAETAAARGITVVPLQVVIGATAYDECGEEGVTPQMLADALREWVPVSTSRPNPETFLEAYRRLAADGAEAIVSVHISAELSGTFESAQLAARSSPVPVTLVDSRQVGMGTGYAVLAAADAIDAGADAAAAGVAARTRAADTTSLFYVDTLEYLRRGGRMGAAAALLGSALAVKPILKLDDGRVGPFEKVRTASRALSRLEEIAVEAAGDAPVDVAVAHLASPDRATELAERLAARLEDGLGGREVSLGEIGAVLGAHVGPGMVAVAVSRRA